MWVEIAWIILIVVLLVIRHVERKHTGVAPGPVSNVGVRLNNG